MLVFQLSWWTLSLLSFPKRLHALSRVMYWNVQLATVSQWVELHHNRYAVTARAFGSCWLSFLVCGC